MADDEILCRVGMSSLNTIQAEMWDCYGMTGYHKCAMSSIVVNLLRSNPILDINGCIARQILQSQVALLAKTKRPKTKRIIYSFQGLMHGCKT